ncbi:GntR family transcriptional regulator [Rathayibacter sp. YIM 133350]|uniref:GntR family transcriptional regulator n=1 Tax=Rathayibacter sp. YIM 133350 TaxID=3131992 RepID=UPI00307CFB34
MIIRIDPSSPVPLFEQLATALRSEIIAGRIADGERLPPARELAASLEVNVHTVLHAYRELRQEGLLDLRRGRGAVVVAREDFGRVGEIVAVLAAEARRLSLASDTVVALVREELAR